MHLTPVTSSQIQAIGYDDATKTLAVQFKSKGGAGAVYHYENVGPDVYHAFSKAESIGKFFATHIKAQPQKYPYTKVPQRPA